MQWAAVCHQHAVWCRRRTHQCCGQLAGILVQLQWAPQRNRLCSAAGKSCSDRQCVSAVYIFIFIRLPDSGEMPTQHWLQVCFHVTISSLLLGPHTLCVHTLLQLENQAFSSTTYMFITGEPWLQWTVLACVSLPSSCVHVLLLA